jgi:hypothetical protein
MATPRKRKADSEFDWIASPRDHDAPRGLWLTTGKECVYGVLAGLGVLEHFQVIGDSEDERLPVIIRLKRNPQRWNAEVACYDDRMCLDVSLIRDAVESLFEEADMVKGKASDSSMLFKCSRCGGKGEVEHDEWIKWQMRHRKDLRAAIGPGESADVPKCEQWST